MISENNPYLIFADWFTDANKFETIYPNAMSLSTVADDGMPDVRIVLLKAFDERGFVFFTNYEGKKGRDLRINPKATICFYWKSLGKQVRISGTVERVSELESDEYFATLPRMSQIGAWASIQSNPMKNSHELEVRVLEYALKFHIGKIPRPKHWGGFRLNPVRIEFWEEKPSRLHNRKQFLKTNDSWVSEHIFP